MSKDIPYENTPSKPKPAGAQFEMIALSGNGLPGVEVDSRSFDKFDAWMDQQLGTLQRRLAHFQTAKMSSRRRNFRQ